MPQPAIIANGVGRAEGAGTLSSAAVNQIANNGVILNQQIGNLINALQTLLPLAGSLGSFTSTAGISTTVLNQDVLANSNITWTPTNAAAASLGAAATAYYLSARTPGVGFSLTTANGGSAAGNETWTYAITNLLTTT